MKASFTKLGLAAAVLAVVATGAVAAHDPRHDDKVKSPFDSLGGAGGTNTARYAAPLLAAADEERSPFDSLGGIGGRDTARATGFVLAADREQPRQPSPFDSLGGIGGANTARAPLAI